MLEIVQSTAFVASACLTAVVVLFALWCTVRYIPNDHVGMIEKLWSSKGSLGEGKIVALNGEAGFQDEILRGGLHFFYWRWQYAVHKRPLITIKQGKIGYVFARAGIAMEPSQTLAKVVECNNFQNSKQFLANGGQKGRQRAILREGVYAINLAIHTVITEDSVYSVEEKDDFAQWQQALNDEGGFDPVIIGSGSNEEGEFWSCWARAVCEDRVSSYLWLSFN